MRIDIYHHSAYETLSPWEIERLKEEQKKNTEIDSQNSDYNSDISGHNTSLLSGLISLYEIYKIFFDD